MNILIVDDLGANRKLLRAQMESEGHAVWEAADGVDALEHLRRDPLDVVISDILMPRMDGYRLCHEIRKNADLKNLPVIIFTATYTSPADEKLALDVGADKYLNKPASVEVLSAALREVVAKAHGAPRPAALPEVDVLQEYSRRLVTKLEQKNLELLIQTTALEHAADAVIITDLGGVVLWANAAFTVLTGYSQAEILGQTPRLVKSGQHGPRFYQRSEEHTSELQ